MAKNIKKVNEDKKIAQALLRHVRIAPRKMRLVANSIKKMNVSDAQAQLFSHERKAGVILLKLLKSAISNAKNKNLEEQKLFIKEIRVDSGAMLKRWMPRAQGRATPIQKKTSHVSLILQEGEKSAKSTFVVEKKKKDKKEEKISKNKKKVDIDKEKEQETKKESRVESKTQDKGFVKRVFRRKSV